MFNLTTNCAGDLGILVDRVCVAMIFIRPTPLSFAVYDVMRGGDAVLVTQRWGDAIAMLETIAHREARAPTWASDEALYGHGHGHGPIFAADELEKELIDR